MREMPFFLTNEEWYEKSFDENGDVRYILTDKAPKEAVESFGDYTEPTGFSDVLPEGWGIDLDMTYDEYRAQEVFETADYTTRVTGLDEALAVAREKYPYPINHFEEYRDYFVFEYDDGVEHDGGPTSPIVIRKSDMAALNYAPIFFNLDADAEDVGDVLAEGEILCETADDENRMINLEDVKKTTNE